MKFICEKCKTKYSIADSKVKGKVLKIRCKNCSNIITVREHRKKGGDGGRPKKNVQQPNPGTGGALSRALDGALREPASQPSRTGGLHLAPVARLDQSPEERKDAESEFIEASTRISAPPDFATLTADGPADDEWYLAVEGNQFGPMGFSELCSRVKRGEAGSEAYVWRDGYEDWRDLEEVKELRPHIPKHPPPPPKGKSGLLNLDPYKVEEGTPAVLPDADPPAAVPLPRPVAAPAPAPEVLAPDGPSPQGPPTAKEVPPDSEVRGAEVSAMAADVLGAADGTPLPSEDINMELTPYAEPIPVVPGAGITTGGSGAVTLPSPAGEQNDESGAAILPLAAAPVTASTVMPAPATPLAMKLAAVGGVVAAITGLVMVIYFIFIDGPKTQDQPPVAVAPTQQPARPPERVAAMNPSAQDEAEVIIEFPAEEVERSETNERLVAKKAVAVAPRPAKKPREPELTDEQKRLQQLYGGGASAGTGGPAELPSAIPTLRKKKRAPARRISASEIGNLQRRNKKALKACYERALKRDNTLTEVKAEIEVSIGDSGIVTQVKVGQTNSRELQICLSRVVKRWPFPAAGAQTVVFPIIFRGS